MTNKLENVNFSIFINTVNVESFAQYMFWRISRRIIDAQKYDVSEKMNYYSANRISS